jgi:hypothetical protein
MSQKLTVDEIAAKGGKSRSDKKLEASRRNLELAKAGVGPKKSQKAEHLSTMSGTEQPPAATDGLLSPAAAGRLSASNPL